MEFMKSFLGTCCDFVFDPNSDITEDFKTIDKIITKSKEDLLKNMKIFHEEFVTRKEFDSVMCGLELTKEQEQMIIMKLFEKSNNLDKLPFKYMWEMFGEKKEDQ